MTERDSTHRPLASVAQLVELVESTPDHIVRQAPAPGEWSALEVLGHIVDKLTIWRMRIEQIAREEMPTLTLYDQDALVVEHGYGQASVADVVSQVQAAEHAFVTRVRGLGRGVLERVGQHPEYGQMSIAACIEIVHASTAEHLRQARTAVAAVSSSRPHPHPFSQK